MTIQDAVELICSIVGYTGNIIYDDTKPDGAPRKLLDITKMNQLGWHAQIELKEGLAQTYQWFLGQYHPLNGLVL
jgi:GDP-L-fucose synthase